MNVPRLKTQALKAAWNVLKTTVLPRRPNSLPSVVPTAAPLLREGELFDNTYRLTRLLGEGAMGAVYEATHARLAGRYAVKLLLLQPTVGSEAIALFDREARITSLLQHPNIVQIIDHNTTADGTEYLVMEYLAGESLAQRLQREAPLPLDTVVGIVDQIAAGLSAAHASRVVHRDLKPDNVFLVPVEGREAESVKILDFGISKVKGSRWGRQAPEGTVMGTPLYMAPEQIEGRVADADGATDQFALAVIAYEMLTGRNPFQAETAGEVFALALHTEPPPMGVGRDVELVVRRGLAKSNRQRFPTITDFSDALRAAAAGRSRETQWAATVAYAAGEVASHDSMGRSGRLLRRVVLTLAAVAGIAIAFVVGGVWNSRASRLGAPSRSAAAEGVAAIVEQLDAREARIARSPGSGIERRPGRRQRSLERRSRSLRSPRRRPRPRRGPVRSAARLFGPPRGRSAPADSLTPDDDATLPATEPSN